MKIQMNFDLVDLKSVSTQIPTLIIGDTLEVMKSFASDMFDTIVDDCGYTDLELHRRFGTTTRLKESKGSNMKWYDVVDYKDTIPEYARLLKKGRHLWIWRPSRNQESNKNWTLLTAYETGLLDTNNLILRKEIPCVKNYIGMGYSFRSMYEVLIFAYKKSETMFEIQNKSTSDVFEEDITLFDDKWKHPRSNERIHDSEKPLGIAQKIIEHSTRPDDIVLEPFAGSFGTGLVNTKFKLGRKVVGIEKDAEIIGRTINHFKSETGFDMNIINFQELKESL